MDKRGYAFASRVTGGTAVLC